ncbi:aldo/keto reductase [Nocardiopsis metallicus]|uniref:Aryl-alcohol dehydrogenase-like predicted oxidoreductase n=1 Tax=Nocardiopsis metallicus TaxID=179819 RepID=A0A840W589_9ACTN|nr:aldo/keto reductase [Nocardiopsis metallicus]MBB5490503.1 aryl-alcohol dehydrogenase-like predicted oxidoreductase [Nocardiopsis metallicus]
MRYRTIGTDPATRREVSVLALGAMLMGWRTDERTSFALLDRYVEAGGTFIDTSNNYGTDGGWNGESEILLGRWLRSRGVGEEVTVATKLGARPASPGTTYVDNREGLSAKVIAESTERSRERLGRDRIDLMYAHIEDPDGAVQETVEAFGEQVRDGSIGLLGVSNHPSWRVERALRLAAASGLPGYEVLQYQHSYLRPRTDMGDAVCPDGNIGGANTDILTYVRHNEGLVLVAYTPLLSGAYVREDKPMSPDYDHPGTRARLKALREVAGETGATPNQVVLAWQLGHDLPIVPLAGVSSLAQLEENLAAVDLELSPEQRVRLDAAR